MSTTVRLPMRALSLDALRGLAILLMLFSSEIPFHVLPSWMYHAQVPPPEHVFNPNLPGITWVDLVFPFFLFAMGAAIPLALSRRLEKGTSYYAIIGSVLLRGVLLVGFAIYVMQIRPYVISKQPNTGTWIQALIGFALLFPVLARLPDNWNSKLKTVIRLLGLAGAATLMLTTTFNDGKGFTPYRFDIIILVLANVSVFGSLIWLLTKRNWLFRIGFLGILLAMRLSSTYDGWVHWIWTVTPASFVYQFRFLQYLFITIPGTIIGDILLSWMKPSSKEPVNNILGDIHASEFSWTKPRLILISLLVIFLNVLLVVGLKARLVLATSLVSLILIALTWYLVKNANNGTEKTISKIFQWGTYWLILGLIFEAYEGGIKKDPATISYYFVTSGLAMFLLIFFIIAVDVFKKERWLRLLIQNGQNPLVAYAGINSLIPPILALTKLDGVIQAITPTPWLGVLRGAFLTYLVALATRFFTKQRIFLRT